MSSILYVNTKNVYIVMENNDSKKIVAVYTSFDSARFIYKTNEHIIYGPMPLIEDKHISHYIPYLDYKKPLDTTLNN
jgi:hypothetical protein